MTESSFGFHFAKTGLVAAQGAVNPSEQYFEGSGAERSIVRETGQNSLDAVAEDGGQVRMEFELATMPTGHIPGIAELRKHLAWVERDTREAQGHDRMKRALDLSAMETVTVLRISDFGTKGLQGSESQYAPPSPLSALTRSAGVSANDGKRGGSFGIGSAVGPMASDLSTVFYTSMPQGTVEVVVAGHSRLASHMDSDGSPRAGDGFYIDRSVTDDFSYLRTRDPFPFGPFAPRTEPGTDIFIIGYRKAYDDPDLNNIRNAFIDSFMMAIHAGRLVVSGVGKNGSWHLDSQSLATYAEERWESRAYYGAITDPSPVVKELPRFGEVALYINVDPRLPKTLYTATMRRPLMQIDTFQHRSIPAKYAAVLVCADSKGNTLLRDLEGPQHNHWDPARKAGGNAALRELKGFVKDALKDRVQDRVGDVIKIKGLARFLPSPEPDLPSNGRRAPGTDRAGRPDLGEGTAHESATVQGEPGNSSQSPVQQAKSVEVKVRNSARSTDQPDGEPVTRGKNASGPGKHSSAGGGMAGRGAQGDGRSRISAGDVTFRSWSAASRISGRTTLQVALSSANDITGDVELVTLGAGGTPEEDYKLPILAARAIVDGIPQELTWEGNVFKDVKVREGRPTRLEVEIEAGRRYRLDVK